MDLINDYKELDKELDGLLMSMFGRNDRHNIDVKNANPSALLQTLAILKLCNKVDKLYELLSKNEEEVVETKEKPVAKKVAKK